MNHEQIVVDAGHGPERVLSAEQNRQLKNIVLAVYALYALAFFFGLTAVAGIVINYVKRDEVQGTWLQSHFDWQIRGFWWGLFWTSLGLLLTATVLLAFIGFPMLIATTVWLIYRVVKGALAAYENRPVQTRRVILNVRL